MAHLPERRDAAMSRRAVHAFMHWMCAQWCTVRRNAGDMDDPGTRLIQSTTCCGGRRMVRLIGCQAMLSQEMVWLKARRGKIQRN